MINILKKGRITILLTFSLLITTYPYVINRLMTLPNESFLSIAFLLIFGVLSIYYKQNNNIQKKIPKAFNICIIVQIILWFFYYLIFNDTSYLSRIFFIILTYLVCYVLVKNDLLLYFISCNNKLISIQAVLGVLTFILVYSYVLDPLIEFENIDGRSAGFYYFNCTNFRLGNFIRIAGFFDEPGALAYWGIYALLFNKLFLKNKIVEYTLLVSLTLTFSAAYFIQAIIYIFFFYARNISTLLTTLIIGGVVIFVIAHYLGEDEHFLYMTTERFTGGEIRSSRSDLSELAKQQFMNSPIWGNGAKNLNKMAYMGDNPYEILAKDGIVGFIITYMPLIYLLCKFINNRNVLFACLILALGYMQRPFHVDLMHSLMLYLFVLLTIFKYSSKHEGNKIT